MVTLAGLTIHEGSAKTLTLASQLMPGAVSFGEAKFNHTQFQKGAERKFISTERTLSVSHFELRFLGSPAGVHLATPA